MACSLDLKFVLKHLANGTIGENLCRVCLKPLKLENCENIFTKICKEDKEYCIADVLRELCLIKISDTDHYSVCPECFIAASQAYKFYINTRCNDELLHYYADELEKYLKTINMTDGICGESICISLPVVSMEMAFFDYNIQHVKGTNCSKTSNLSKESSIKKNIQFKEQKPFNRINIDNGDNEIIIVKDENGQSSFYEMQSNSAETVEHNVKFDYKPPPQSVSNVESKKRKKREPMTSKRCTRCPIKYRFIAKLRDHMRREHGVTLYSCKVCQALTEDEEFHKFHIRTHTNVYKCDICNVTFKKRDAVMNHMRDHEVIKNASSVVTDYVCVQCGLILEDKESLNNHVDMNHYKKFACFYCGRVYKVKESFDKHIQKHEIYMKAYKDKRNHEKRSFSTAEAKQLIAASEAQLKPSRDYTCELCGRSFLGARALLWHGRLHSNEKPFACDTCGRAFVSLNRRNQHALCAHTPPTRRCPLCPARFHLRSMVNTHVKKVHLKVHKRRSRAVAVSGGPLAAPVPVQELSVALQQDVLELQARHGARDLDYAGDRKNIYDECVAEL